MLIETMNVVIITFSAVCSLAYFAGDVHSQVFTFETLWDVVTITFSAAISWNSITFHFAMACDL